MKSLSSKFYSCHTKMAFTLAEVLITLAIIGMIYDMTIPTLFNETSDRAIYTAKETMNAKLLEAMNQARVREKLTDYATAEDFANEFKNYIKITDVCKSNELEKCFGYSSIKTYKGKLNISELSDPKKFVKDKIGTYQDAVGVTFINGTVGVLAYNKDCSWLTPFEAGGSKRSEAAKCLSIIYDVNGAKKPNEAGRDVAKINATIPGECEIKLSNDKCGTFYSAESYSPMNCQECGESTAGDCVHCHGTGLYAADYWAGAEKICGAKAYMATEENLAALSSKIYGTTCTIGSSCVGQYNSKVALEYGLPPNGDFFILTDYLANSQSAYGRFFYNSESKRSSSLRSTNGGVICIEH